MAYKQLFKNNEPLGDHVKAYLQENKEPDSKQTNLSKELFNVDNNDNLDLKTDLEMLELLYLNAMKVDDLILKKYHLKPLFNSFVTTHERHKISLDRKARSEFVITNKAQSDEGAILDTMSKVDLLTHDKK